MGADATSDRRTARARSRSRRGRASAQSSRPQRDELPVSEASLEAALVDLAKLYHWRAYHIRDSRTDDARADHGFPDWLLLRGDRMIVLELKSKRGTVRPNQREWLEAFAAVARIDVAIVRPADDADELELLLR
jgi:hypothetical protein